jgi:ferric-dicitrate binding protein FerR (iron transport regulator)
VRSLGLQFGLVKVALCVLLLAGFVPAQSVFPGVTAQGTPAKIRSLTGQVSVYRDGAPWALKAGDGVLPAQEVQSGPDGHAIFELADGSTFELFPNSRATFRNTAGTWSDLLELWIGRVKVHIQRVGGRPNPNRVTTPTAVISVRGTIFDITVEEPDETLVLVEEGQVAVQHAIMPYGAPRLLNAGDYLRVYKNEPLVRNRYEKGDVIQRVFNALAQAVQAGRTRVPTVGGGTGGAGGSRPLPGDSGGGGDVPPPPPPPPPPPL